MIFPVIGFRLSHPCLLAGVQEAKSCLSSLIFQETLEKGREHLRWHTTKEQQKRDRDDYEANKVKKFIEDQRKKELERMEAERKKREEKEEQAKALGKKALIMVEEIQTQA